MKRRTFVRGAGSLAAASGLGFFGGVARNFEAHAAETAPSLRLVVFVVANGLDWQRYRAAGKRPSGASGDVALTLGPALSAFEAHQADMLLVEGLGNPFDRGLHGNGFAALSVTKGGNEELPGGISFDRFMAQRLGATTRFDSINLATAFKDSDPCHRSADGAGQPFPAEKSPLAAYSRLFDKLDASGTDAAKLRLLRDQSLLDFAQDDIGRLKASLGSFEKQKLEQYSDSLRDLERRLVAEQGATPACARGEPPTVGDANSDAGERMLISDELIEAQLGIGFNALLCGLTRIATINFGTSAGGVSHYGFQKLVNSGSHHKYCHDQNMAALLEIDGYIYQKIAAFWSKLKSVPEGNGSMADSTVILIVNDGGGRHHDGWNDIPFITLGSLGGKLKTGRMITVEGVEAPYEAYDGLRVSSDYYVALANAFGIETTTFGEPSVCKGALREILA